MSLMGGGGGPVKSPSGRAALAARRTAAQSWCRGTWSTAPSLAHRGTTPGTSPNFGTSGTGPLVRLVTPALPALPAIKIRCTYMDNTIIQSWALCNLHQAVRL